MIFNAGLDSSRYHHKTHEDDDEEEARARLLSEDEKYKLCERLEIICQFKNCGRKNIIDCPVRPGRVGILYGLSDILYGTVICIFDICYVHVI